MNCIIVEDLPVAAEYTKRCCERIGNFDVKGIFASVPEALAYLDHNYVDLLFLDIEMPGENGFQLLDQLPYKPKVILTTSNTDHAYAGFEYKVNDFLKKPFTYQRFTEAAQKLKPISLETIKPAKQTTADNDSIYIKTEGKLLKLMNNEILYMESMGDYVKFVTKFKKHLTHHTIKGLEQKLNPASFMRVHRSFLVNLNAISDLKENALVIDGKEIPVSKAHRREVLRRLPIL